VTPKSDIRAEAEALQAVFTAAGAVPVDAPLMLSADTLLDLYGEDIRARAYTTHDPDRGEMMLRPDFTVPVVEMHAEHGSEPARYTYLGEVFRKQPVGSGRPSEYLQLGFELFDRGDPAKADAEVFALFSEALAGLGLRAVTGDMGILLAAIESLSTTERAQGRAAPPCLAPAPVPRAPGPVHRARAAFAGPRRAAGPRGGRGAGRGDRRGGR
jgi:ATP phosphoribosyltransferase regulatory subunit